MKKIFILLALINVCAFSQIKFEDYFENKSLRIDYFHTGDYKTDTYSLDELREEPFWGGSKTKLIDPFNYGVYRISAYDSIGNKLLYSRTYSGLYHEWQTTNEAKTTVKSITETVTLPFPKKTIKVVFEARNKKNILEKKYELFINPNNYFIEPQQKQKLNNFKVHNSGDPAVKVDIVIIPEGYTKEEMDKFKKDCEKFSNYLFRVNPYKQNINKFNIWGVEAVSEETGTDIPANDTWKKTILDTRFFTFDLDRYLMTTNNKAVRDIAANAPYDQIYILVNTNKYGGGSIYNYYNVCINNNIYEEYVFTHEFGHGFAFLADEYFTSDVAYNDFYQLDAEPLEANLTTLVNFDKKWKHLVEKNIPVPTPTDDKYKNKVGAFEGGGYVAKGIYRPKQNCSMNGISVDNFCPVCREAISEMINLYTE